MLAPPLMSTLADVSITSSLLVTSVLSVPLRLTVATTSKVPSASAPVVSDQALPLTFSPDPTVYVTPCTVTDNVSPATFVQVPAIVGVSSFVVSGATAGLFSATTLVLLLFVFVVVVVFFVFLGCLFVGLLFVLGVVLLCFCFFFLLFCFVVVLVWFVLLS